MIWVLKKMKCNKNLFVDKIIKKVMSKDKYTRYSCPTCGNNAKVFGNIPDKCEYCSKVICPKCGRLFICPECQNKLNDLQLTRLKKAVKAAERSKKFGMALIIAGLVLMIPLMIIADSWIFIILGIFVIPIGSLVTTIKISGKISDVLEEIRHENSDFGHNLNIRMRVGKIE